MKNAEIIVVGAGPAGLMAALAAARTSCRVLVLERMPRPGLKLLASGGGRCNLTNLLSIERFMESFGRNGRFLEPALRIMGPARLCEFFSQLGVPTFSPDGFHVYPRTQKSQTVLEALLKACRNAGVIWRCGTLVDKLLIKGGRITGVGVEHGEPLCADAVILATGGKTYPQLSGTTTGYDLAVQAGHERTPLYPALVSLIVREPWLRECGGVSLHDAEVWLAERPRCRMRGGVLFTHEGLSGPAVLNLSREVTPILAEQQVVRVCLRVTQPPNGQTWAACLTGWRRERGRKMVRTLLDELLPASLARTLARCAGIAPETTAARLTKEAQQRLTAWLDSVPLTVVGCAGDEHAMVTRGGVSLKQVDPHTLQSRLVSGLYFAGEMLDLDGPCGGFNLQWAFASGWLAGEASHQQNGSGLKYKILA